jgi:hypothetical protein
MKIQRETILGEEHLITPCADCCFYDNITKACDFGRIKKYKEKQQTLGGVDNIPYKILTFCNHARPHLWQKENETKLEAKKRVKYDNRIKYDLIVRLTDPTQADLVKPFLERLTPPEHVIFSFESINIGELVERANDLGCSFELIKIQDPDARAASELKRVQRPWSETVDLNKKYSTTLIDDFSRLINDDLEQIVAVLGDQYVMMTMLVASLDIANINFSFDNIQQIATQQNMTNNIRSFDGERIRHYSQSQLQ